MLTERRRIEREWVEARAERALLQSEALKAKRESRTIPSVQPEPELLARYEQAKRRCKALDNAFFALLGSGHRHDANG